MKKKFLFLGAIVTCLGAGTVFAATSNISMEKAQSIALKKIPGATIKSIELDHEFGKAIYDIDLVLNQYEYDLKLDAKTGSGISVKKELRDDYNYANAQTSVKPQVSTKPQNTTSQQTSKFITSEQAKAAALKKVPGATVRKVEFDKEDGVYELELRKGLVEYDVVVSAKSGQVLVCEIDD